MSGEASGIEGREFVYEALPGRVVFGPGSARRELAGAIEALGARRLLLIAATSEAELAEELAAPLGERVVGRFDGVRPHVPVEVGAAAVEAARAAGADAVLSVGGGSTTGTAKAVALATGLPIVAVPTTYAGSEMTPVWGSTEGGTKTTGRDLKVLPRLVVYDPELTVSLPAAITAASGMNALAHSVEALYAPGRNPVTTAIALESIAALAAALPAVVAAPEDVGARGEALYGAYLAGSAFAVAGSGLHHKVCHALGGAFDLPHAETHSVVLPHVVAFQQPAAGVAMDRVAGALGTAPGGAAGALYDLAAGLGVPLSLAAIGMPADGVERVVEPIVAAVPADNPRPVGADDVRAILAAAYAGERP
ncbi:MAG: maleylacetate reductase [Solirubrobacterales bacterium]